MAELSGNMQGKSGKRDFLYWYSRIVRVLAIGLMYLSGGAIFSMMVLVCIDVVLRQFGRPISGSNDIVSLLGAVTLACALPYTTAVKGHVAIEYFFHKLNRRGRLITDTVSRTVVIALFVLLGWQSIAKGNSMRASGQVTPTLELPDYWVLYIISLCSFAVALVVFDHLVHPRREMIKP